MVRVRSSNGFTGTFESRATQWDFPLAFDTLQYSDDPSTMTISDATRGEVVPKEEIQISADIRYTCDSEGALISSPIEALTYNWNTGSTESVIEVNSPGTYILRAENECIVFVDSITIQEFPGPDMVQLTGTEEVLLGNRASIFASTNLSGPLIYTWTAGDSTETCMCPDFQFIPEETTVVDLLVTDDRGCDVTGSFVVNTIQIRNTYAPNAFSPNRDGVNDFFFIQSSSPGTIRELSVFNRWGNEIAHKTNLPLNDELSGWDGTMKNEMMPSGVYIWMAEVEYFDGHREIIHGEVVLIGR